MIRARRGRVNVNVEPDRTLSPSSDIISPSQGEPMRALFAGMFLALSLQTAALAQHSHSHAPGHSQAKGTEELFGAAADPQNAKRIVRVEMADNMRFTPAEIKVARGEVVRF